MLRGCGSLDGRHGTHAAIHAAQRRRTQDAMLPQQAKAWQDAVWAPTGLALRGGAQIYTLGVPPTCAPCPRKCNALQTCGKDLASGSKIRIGPQLRRQVSDHVDPRWTAGRAPRDTSRCTSASQQANAWQDRGEDLERSNMRRFALHTTTGAPPRSVFPNGTHPNQRSTTRGRSQVRRRQTTTGAQRRASSQPDSAPHRTPNGTRRKQRSGHGTFCVPNAPKDSPVRALPSPGYCYCRRASSIGC